MYMYTQEALSVCVCVCVCVCVRVSVCLSVCRKEAEGEGAFISASRMGKTTYEILIPLDNLGSNYFGRAKTLLITIIFGSNYLLHHFFPVTPKSLPHQRLIPSP